MLSLVPPPAILPANGYPAGIAPATPTCLFHLFELEELDLYLILLFDLDVDLLDDDFELEDFELLEEPLFPLLLVDPLPPPPPPLRLSRERREEESARRGVLRVLRKGTNMLVLAQGGG